MSNCKQISIVGWMPFCIYENEEALKVLGRLNCPSISLKIQYLNQEARDNEFGGKTLFYKFWITGVEALSFVYIEKMKNVLVSAGCEINYCDITPIE